ncbi:MAG: sulfotransferase domain-containing protein [Isosphaerales bacterium]
MVKNGDQEKGKTRFRLDFAARLFRPHWPSFRRTRPVSRRSERVRPSPTMSEPTEPGQRPLDVFCAGMYRACSTWQYEVAAHLIERAYDGQRLGYLTSEQYARLVRTDVEEPPSALSGKRCWRVAKSHEGDRSFAAALAGGRALAVYAYRDVRDVVFSLMHKRGMTFEQLLRQGMIHQILANDRFWMAQPDVLVQRYEDLLADPAGGVKELARHLGIPLAESEAAHIADEYSQEANRARAEALRRRLHEAGVNLDSAANVQICDPTTLLHWNHIRSSSSLSWRSWATPRQLATLDRLCGRWLEERGYLPGPIATRRTAFSPRALRERARGEADLWAARSTIMIRTISQRFPATARAVKRLLGLPAQTQAGAMAWADPVPSRETAPAEKDRSAAGARLR